MLWPFPFAARCSMSSWPSLRHWLIVRIIPTTFALMAIAWLTIPKKLCMMTFMLSCRLEWLTLHAPTTPKFICMTVLGPPRRLVWLPMPISSFPFKPYLIMLMPFIGTLLHLHVKSLSPRAPLTMEFGMFYLFVAQ